MHSKTEIKCRESEISYGQDSHMVSLLTTHM